METIREKICKRIHKKNTGLNSEVKKRKNFPLEYEKIPFFARHPLTLE